MTDTTLESAADELERAADLETDRALAVLRSAHDDVQRLRDDPDVNENDRLALERRLEQRMREVRNRDDYDGAMGAAMEPEEEDAP